MENKKQNYEAPEIEVVEIEVKDSMASSGVAQWEELW